MKAPVLAHREISAGERRAGLKSKYLRSPDWGIHRQMRRQEAKYQSLYLVIALFITPGAIRRFHIDNLSGISQKTRDYEITRDMSEWRVVGVIRIVYIAGGLISFPGLYNLTPIRVPPWSQVAESGSKSEPRKLFVARICISHMYLAQR